MGKANFNSKKTFIMKETGKRERQKGRESFFLQIFNILEVGTTINLMGRVRKST